MLKTTKKLFQTTEANFLKPSIGNYFNCQIRTPEFTKFAADTICSSRCEQLVFHIKFQDLFWAKMDTYAASFAPFIVYNMLF